MCVYMHINLYIYMYKPSGPVSGFTPIPFRQRAEAARLRTNLPVALPNPCRLRPETRVDWVNPIQADEV